jgi:CRISPR-associated protein Cas2
MPMLVVKYYKNALTTSRKTREKPPSASDFQLQYRQKLIVNHGKGGMKGFGDPIHYSVFRCDLTLKGRVEMSAALAELIKHDEDRIMIVDLGPVEGQVEERIEFMGVHPEEPERKAIIL